MPPSIVPSSGSAAGGGFSKRASRIISNGQLYDLVQDMAGVLDARLPAIEQKLDMILELLREKIDG